jgi:sirohydrochlorin cobaltochelatase
MTQTQATASVAENPSARATGLIVFAHGSRDPLWRGPTEAIAQRIAQEAPQLQVATAYLELCEPDLPTAVHGLLAQGVQRIEVLPAFLGVGRHARHDLPEMLQSMAAAHPQVQFVLHAALGEDSRLIDAAAHIALQPFATKHIAACAVSESATALKHSQSHA